MIRDMRIRQAVSHLSGTARTAMIEALCLDPTRVTTAIRTRTRGLRERRTSAYSIKWSVQLTPEQYMTLRDTARASQITMAALTRQRLFGGHP